MNWRPQAPALPTAPYPTKSSLPARPGTCHVAAGNPVGLAVDGSASNDGSNMLAELKAALLIAKLTWGIDSSLPGTYWPLPPGEGLSLLGRQDIGSLAPGKAADMFLVRADSIDYAGCNDPITALVTCGSSETVDTTIVNAAWWSGTAICCP